MGTKDKKFSLEDMLAQINMETKTAMEHGKEEEKKEEKKMDAPKGEMKDEKKEEKKEEKAAANTPATSAASPVTDAMKLAEKLASMEKEALLKEAHLIGKAIIDGAQARVQELEKVATAPENLTQEKVAHLYNTDPEFRQSFDQGYMDKIAEEIENNPEAKRAFQEGYEKTAAELTKVASFMQDRGFSESGAALARFKMAQAK